MYDVIAQAPFVCDVFVSNYLNFDWVAFSSPIYIGVDLKTYMVFLQAFLTVFLDFFVIQVACMNFINIIVHSAEDLNFRVHLQSEFTQLGLDDYLNVSHAKRACFVISLSFSCLWIVFVQQR